MAYNLSPMTHEAPHLLARFMDGADDHFLRSHSNRVTLLTVLEPVGLLGSVSSPPTTYT